MAGDRVPSDPPPPIVHSRPVTLRTLVRPAPSRFQTEKDQKKVDKQTKLRDRKVR